MNTHSVSDLKQYQSLSLQSKIIMTKARIRNWHEHYEGNVYVSFSGGKDSTVLLHLVRSIYPEIPAVFCNTGLEYPEVRMFATSQDNVTVIRPKMPFNKVIENYGYPVISKEQSSYIYEVRTTKSEKLKNTRLNGTSYAISKKWKYMLDAPFKISNKCCDVMKKAPFKKYEKETGRKPYLGTMCNESNLRLNSWLRNGCNAFETSRPQSRPLSFWTEQDILQYIVENDLKIAKVYGDIKQDENGKYYLTNVDRTGCMFCMFGVHLEQYPNRFQKMQLTHPKQYNYCMNELKIKEVLDYMEIPYKLEEVDEFEEENIRL